MNPESTTLLHVLDSAIGMDRAYVETPVLDFFHSLSNVELGAFLIVSALMLSVIIPYSVRVYFKIEPSEPLAKGAEEGFKAFISLTFLLLAFSLVRVQSDHRGVDDLVSRESTVIIKLDRAARTYGGDDGVAVQRALLNYTAQMLKVEWPLLAKGERDSLTTEYLTVLSLATKKLDPVNPAQQIARTEILASFTQLSDLREARLAATRIHLPVYYWHAMAFCFAVLVVLAWFQHPVKKAVPYVGGVASALMLLLTVLLASAGIFKSENAVSNEPIRDALVQIVGKNTKTKE